MKPAAHRILLVVLLVMPAAGLRAAGETVATAVYARVGNGYERERQKGGAFQSEYYALSNGGRIDGTTSDGTVDRVSFAQVAEVAAQLLARQNYHYAQSKEQAKLLLVLQWGSTVAFNRVNYSTQVGLAAAALAAVKAEVPGAAGDFETEMLKMQMANRARDEINTHNARVLGYLDELADSNDIRRWAGGGDRYNDLIADVEEERYYIMISAYDFAELSKKENKKLLWQTRVSVRSPGNSFDDSMVAMLKSASKYFGADSGRLVRGEESKGTVEFGDLKFLGEAKKQQESSIQENK